MNEKIIDGVLHFEEGDIWRKATKRELTAMLIEARRQRYPDPYPFYADPRAPKPLVVANTDTMLATQKGSTCADSTVIVTSNTMLGHHNDLMLRAPRYSVYITNDIPGAWKKAKELGRSDLDLVATSTLTGDWMNERTFSGVVVGPGVRLSSDENLGFMRIVSRVMA